MLPAPGEEFSLGRWVVDHGGQDAYLSAVGDASTVYRELGVAPPMAVAARVLSALLKELALPPGTIHAAQELGCGLVKLGEEVSCSAKLSRPLQRGDWRFISADFSVRGSDGETLLEGKATVLVPVAEAAGG